ncbi:hypothetical protein NEUTE1DRAFT_63973 [Neurospora tetrasperma FGSC 2508]|uniref:DUF7907 domain-containing protein n=1 Tax=Neurospora tetrasperma (strain FGSC 2508 / ATCC MYA-4615 / P0657) TaxID=510951 RepID=F8MKN8_NEUT8|nr:uncharacterized protein NEUTE1DRAFT_63973 [Neurospora tetrasperma FGSC 2508]EGO58266.1 hypothetical protein NEUTE1DRAFT_63973 [Neurospora tetrasperma FGSC 2508]EGZ71417.1 hypothetical protein NEUTE2DRAFT_109910 [Neurospora tetrasperma FGSC 2509]
MKSFTLSGVLAALTATAAVQAQTYSQDGPFNLKLKSDDSSLDGKYLYACHAGAAIESLCLGSTESPAGSSSASFYYNYTVNDNVPSNSGLLIWNLQANGQDGVITVSSPLSFNYDPGSNVATTLFMPSTSPSLNVAFDNEDQLFVPTYTDDSKYVPGQYPQNTGAIALQNWQACWAQVGGYYYNVLAWVTSGAPKNPTCKAVKVAKVAVLNTEQQTSEDDHAEKGSEEQQLEGDSAGEPVAQIGDGQVQNVPANEDGEVVTQIGDGQIQNAPAEEGEDDDEPVSQIGDGQVQNDPVEEDTTPITQIGDGQVQNAPAEEDPVPVAQIGDGQIQNTPVPVTQSNDGQI